MIKPTNPWKRFLRSLAIGAVCVILPAALGQWAMDGSIVGWMLGALLGWVLSIAAMILYHRGWVEGFEASERIEDFYRTPLTTSSTKGGAGGGTHDV